MSKKILVIDDDHVATTLLESRLGKAGYEMFSANTGTMGIKMAKNLMPDVIILDVEMPDMNGYDVILDLKEDEYTENIRVIVQTSHEENKPIFARKGVKDYLVKPVDPARIIEVLEGEEA